MDEVLEILMFKHPSEWGKRIVKRNNEVILQSTNNNGVTWTDDNPLQFSLHLPEIQTRSTTTNVYAGLTCQDKIRLRNSSEAKDIKLGEELQNIVDSGSLLSYEEVTGIDKNTGKETRTEVITFFGVMAYSALQVGMLYRDANGFVKIVL